jgi:hypothetical protein
MQGVVWALPKQMFERLGGRLTGSLALSFIPTKSQGSRNGEWTPEPLPMLAHAVIYADGKQVWVPAKNKFVELLLTPMAGKLGEKGNMSDNHNIKPNG